MAKNSWGHPYRSPWASGAPSVGTNSVVNKKRTGLSPTMSVEQFDNGYWYATEVRSFAKSIGIPRVSALRKDELEDLIKHFLRTGKVKVSARRIRAPLKTADSARPITRRRRVVHYKNDRATRDFLEDGLVRPSSLGSLHQLPVRFFEEREGCNTRRRNRSLAPAQEPRYTKDLRWLEDSPARTISPEEEKID